jgi:hypothetical protein
MSRTILRVAALAAALLLPPSAHALLFRAYLAPDGLDTNACTLSQPCRLLPAALAAVADGGEIWLLDSANYNAGPVNIAKSVTVLAVPGAVGSVVATGGGNAIDITMAGVEVALRNLVIVPLAGGGGTGGVNMTAGAGLTMDHCLVAGVAGSGVAVSAGAFVRISDTTIRGSGAYGLRLEGGARGTLTRVIISGNASDGVSASASGAYTTALHIAGATIDGNSNGVVAISSHASGVVKASIQDSQVVRNTTFGVRANSTALGPVTFSISNSTIADNFTGISASLGGTRVIARGNVVTDNFYGLDNAGATAFESAGDNVSRNNSVNKNGVVTVVTLE